MKYYIGLILGIVVLFTRLSSSLPFLCNASHPPQLPYGKLKLIHTTHQFCISEKVNTPHKPISPISEKKNENLSKEILAGAVVALATIPTSISYSTVVGINPITGIWNSVAVGLCTTVVGGAPGMLLASIYNLIDMLTIIFKQV